LSHYIEWEFYRAFGVPEDVIEFMTKTQFKMVAKFGEASYYSIPHTR